MDQDVQSRVEELDVQTKDGESQGELRQKGMLLQNTVITTFHARHIFD